MEPYFQSMAGAESTGWGSDVTPPAMSATVALGGMDVFVDLAGLIDVEAEVNRLEKELEKLPGFITAKEKKLLNESFVARAPADVVQKERESLEELKDRLTSIQASLAELRKKIRKELPELAGVRVFFREESEEGGNSRSFAVKFFGQDSTVLQ